MALDVVDLREFYVSALGRFVRSVLRRHLAAFWPDLTGETVLALGYGTPLLRPWMEAGVHVMAMMPAAQGVVFWPRQGPNKTCMADLTNLPLPDCSVDRIVLAHTLELAAEPEAVLDEAWRVLKPNGRMIVIAPNRRGLWAFSETTPFGSGRPFSTSQLRELLKNQDFVLERRAKALVAPPHASRLGLFVCELVERTAPTLFTTFGGVLIVEACKQIYTPAMVKSRSLGRRLLLPMPFPSSPVPSNREKTRI